MKVIYGFIAAMVALFAVSCSGSASKEAAEPTETYMSVDSLLANAEALTDSLIYVEGVCTHTCRHGATKMFIVGTDDSKTIRVEACELGSFSADVRNSLVDVTGYLREQRIDENYLVDLETQIAEGKAEKHGENGDGCETERAAHNLESTSLTDQIAEYRKLIAEQVEAGGNPWLSFYYIEAKDYEVK